MPDLEMEMHDSLDNAIRGVIEMHHEIQRLRAHLRALAEAVIDSVSNCEGVVSIEAEHQARLALEEVLPSTKPA